MTWFKVDDSFYDHPKIFDAPDCAVALWVRAGCWSARNLTDGFVPANMPARLCDDPERAVRELIQRGLWKRVKGGYQFHDWSDYQPTRASVEEQRAAARERMRKLRAGRKTAGQAGNGSLNVRANNKRTSREVRNPRPDPNTLTGCSGSGGGPALPEPAAPDLTDATHVYKPAPYGECAECGLPAGNRRHLRLVDAS